MRRPIALLTTALLSVGGLALAPAAAPAAGGQATTITLAGDSFGDGLDALRATLASPWGIAVGPDGIYISDNSHYQIRLLRPDGVIEKVAGTSVGYGGDGGAATLAQMNRNRGIAFDREGRLLIADSGNSRIRRVDLTSGMITTVAGDGNRTYAGDGGPATQASLAFPYDVTGDRFGNIYIADYENSRIRRVTASGTMETIAGHGSRDNLIDPQPNDFDGVPASTASVKPTAVLTDADGNLYFGDAFGCRIRKIDRASRTVTTLAGDGCGYAGDGGPATAAQFMTIWDLAFDPQGRIVVADADNNRIRRIESDGTVATIVGDGQSGCPTAESPATGPAGTWPIAIAYDAEGTLHYASNNCGRTYAASGGTIRPTAGRGGTYAGDAGDPATSMNFTAVEAVAWGPDGLPYFSDTRGIWKVDEDGAAVLVAGGQNGDADGPALEAKFRNIRGMAFDDSGALWIADLGAGKIKRLANGVVETMAGNPGAPAATVGTDGPALGIRLTGVIDVVPAPDGSVYFNEATEVSGRVRRLADGQVTLVAGPRDSVNQYLAPIGDGGPATAALFRYLRGVAVAPDGSLLVVDSQHHRIRRVVPGGTINTIAGDGGEVSRGDGTIAELASFSSPEDVAIDAAGNMFITDGKNEYGGQPALYTIRHVAPNGMVATIAGTGSTGGIAGAGTLSLSGRGGSGPSLQFPLTNPQALDLGPKGLLVADSTSVRLIEPPAGGWPSPVRVVRCDSYFPDVEGDAKAQVVVSFVYTPNQPWLDILDADVKQDGTNLTVTFELLDLNERALVPPTAELGNAWAWYYRFKVGTRYKYLAAYSPYSPPGSPQAPGVVYEHGNGQLGRGVSTHNVTRVGAATGTFDMAKDRVTISAPLSALGISPGEQVFYHEAITGELVEVAFSRFVGTDDNTSAPGFLPGTTRSYTFGKRCPEDY